MSIPDEVREWIIAGAQIDIDGWRERLLTYEDAYKAKAVLRWLEGQPGSHHKQPHIVGLDEGSP